MPDLSKGQSDPNRTFKVAKSLAKRSIDIVLALFMLTLLLPAFALIASGILLESEGPILDRIPHRGLNGRRFCVLRFRTLSDRQAAPGPLTRRGAKYTRVGGLLHATCLDGLPQLYNILTGQMSFVGPRLRADAEPETLKKVQDYDLCFEARPGLTGLAQVRGYYRDTSKLEDLFTGLYYDIEYIKTWSLGLDLKTLVTAAHHALFKPHS